MEVRVGHQHSPYGSSADACNQTPREARKFGAWPYRMKVKRRKASHRVSWPPAAKPEMHRRCECIGDGMVMKSVVTYPGRSVGFRVSGSP